MKKLLVAVITLTLSSFLISAVCSEYEIADRSITPRGVSAFRNFSSADVGDPAPNFTLVNAINGDTISLIDYRGKAVLLDFFATWCGPCRRAIDEDLVPLYGKYADNPKVAFLSIDIAESQMTAGGLQAFASEHLMKWPILMGSTSSVAQDYIITGVPTIFVVDSAGVIGQRHLGSPGAATLSNEIDSLVASMYAVNIHLFGSATEGWGLTASDTTSPGPMIVIRKGDVVNLTLTSKDGLPHKFFVDYSGDGSPSPGEPTSPEFQNTISHQFNATKVGNFTYYCQFHPNIMHGTFVVQRSEPLPADLNGDGVVNILDISIVARAFNSKPGDSNWNPTADLDKNGVVNILDISKVAKDFGETADP